MLIPEIQCIVCAACLYPSGKMLVGPRHFDSVMVNQYHLFDLKDEEEKSIQGFIDQWGNFLTREEAYIIAEKQNQICRDIGYKTDKLFSEHLY